MGPFKPDASARQRLIDFVGQELARASFGADARFHAVPLDSDAGRIDGAYGSFGHFGSDAVAGD